MKKFIIALGISFITATYGLSFVDSSDTYVDKPVEQVIKKTKTKKKTKDSKQQNTDEPSLSVDKPIAQVSSENESQTEVPVSLYSGYYLQTHGAILWNNYKWTWYSEKVLPGGGLNIPGRHADEQGFICDADNYICLASSTLVRGSIVDTPFGKAGKIYDSGCAAGVLDVYVNW